MRLSTRDLPFFFDMVHSMFLFEVKKPEESKGPWDYYKVLAEVPADQAFRPLKDGGCPLVK